MSLITKEISDIAWNDYISKPSIVDTETACFETSSFKKKDVTEYYLLHFINNDLTTEKLEKILTNKTFRVESDSLSKTIEDPFEEFQTISFKSKTILEEIFQREHLIFFRVRQSQRKDLIKRTLTLINGQPLQIQQRSRESFGEFKTDLKNKSLRQLIEFFWLFTDYNITDINKHFYEST